MKNVLLAMFLAAGHAGAALAQLQVDEPWARSTVPGQKVAGVFLKVKAPPGTALLGGSTPAARAVELHQTVMKDNVARMLPVQRIAVPKEGTIELRPGGYHLMLIDIARPLAKGDRLPLQLDYEEGGTKKSVKLEVEVRDVMAPRGGAHHKH